MHLVRYQAYLVFFGRIRCTPLPFLEHSMCTMARSMCVQLMPEPSFRVYTCAVIVPVCFPSGHSTSACLPGFEVRHCLHVPPPRSKFCEHETVLEEERAIDLPLNQVPKLEGVVRLRPKPGCYGFAEAEIPLGPQSAGQAYLETPETSLLSVFQTKGCAPQFHSV